MRVEVLDAEEIDEKLMMTPGDVVMMLNEMGGMRVQATSPSLGAASVRIQGMRGRYTRFLSDGLPLFGEQVSLGLMQIPPLDLGRVEVIKGVASSLYGAGAMSGVVNLVSRRPGTKPERQLLLNRSSRGATDAGSVVLHAAVRPLGPDAARERQRSAAYRCRRRWVGRSPEVRAGGRASAPVLGQPCGPDVLRDRRRHLGRPHRWLDAGRGPGACRRRVRRSARHAAVRCRRGVPDAVGERRDVERARVVDVAAPESSIRRGHRARRPRHRLRRTDGPARDRPAHAGRRRGDRARPIFGRSIFHVSRYTFTVPGVFVQDDVDVARWLAMSASARLDQHSEFGTFVSPRISGLVRHGPWSSRLSYGTGFFAPTPITEETEAAGLSRLTVVGPLKPERGRSASFDVTRTQRPAVDDADAVSFHRQRSGRSRAHRALSSSGIFRRRRPTRASKRSRSGRRTTFRSSPTTRTSSRVKPPTKAASTCR